MIPPRAAQGAAFSLRDHRAAAKQRTQSFELLVEHFE